MRFFVCFHQTYTFRPVRAKKLLLYFPKAEVPRIRRQRWGQIGSIMRKTPPNMRKM